MEETQSHSDEALARLVQAGDTDSYGVLVERYQARLLRYGRKFLSDSDDIVDIVQDVFMNAYQNIQSFDTIQSFSPWLYRIAHNAFANALKKKSYRLLSFIDFDTLVSHAGRDESIDAERDQVEIKKMIDAGLTHLAPKYREVLVLYYLEGMSYKAIADIVRVPVGTVGIRIRRAKKQLRLIYAKLNISYGA
ncbi:MAG: RNA polymerase sigma factor [Patescibacteria group bacterium]